jgi:hypothetical protein
MIDSTPPEQEVDVEAVTVDPSPAPPPEHLVSGEATSELPAPTVAPEKKATLHCPILIDEDHIDFRTVTESIIGQTKQVIDKIIHRQPEQTLVNPVQCPSCSKWVERHMLCVDAHGSKDCPVAASVRANPRYAKLFSAINAHENDVIASEIARLGDEARRIAETFGPTTDGVPVFSKAYESMQYTKKPGKAAK